MDGHAHISIPFALDVIAIMFIAHFLARAWAGLRPDSAPMRGLSFVA
jgi:hypothetical protein